MGRAKTQPSDRSINLGSDFLLLNVADAPPGGRATWLASQLRLAISTGRVPVGDRLPATRVLAADLGVSRGVVTEAYQRLVEDGHLEGRGRAGTIVVAGPVGPPVKRAATTRPALDSRLPGPFGVPVGPDVFDVYRSVASRIDLTPGVPDLTAFPRAAWLRAERAVFDHLTPTELGYGDPQGTLALRLAVATWLARNRGITADPKDIVIVAGVAQAIGLLAEILRNAGITTVAVEEPGSLGVRQHLRDGQLATPPIPVDSEGLRVEDLNTSGVSAVVLTPAHQFPTGVVLSGERRRQLMGWAGRGGLIIEDDYDAEHRYDRPPVPALHRVMPESVCYVGSVSKVLAPALRVGWIIVPTRYHDALVAAKRRADLGNPTLPQLVLARLMESGQLERQIRFLRHRHVRRRDAMMRAIRTHLPDARVHGVEAGLHLMITFTGAAAHVADVDLATAALARGVKVQPLSWHRQHTGEPGLVLGYAANSPTDIDDALATLGAALRDVRGQPTRGHPARAEPLSSLGCTSSTAPTTRAR